MTSHHDRDPIPAPWVLIDDLTVGHTADLLERLVHWLSGPDTGPAANCTRSLTLGETNDPVTLASYADALAARLRRRAEESQLDLTQFHD
jgi:hypothetical protein